MELISLGKIIDSFSLDGTMKILSSTSFASSRYKKGNKVFIVDSENNIEEVTVASFRENGDLNFVRFEEIPTKEDALAKKGCLIQINKEEATLPKNYYHYSDLEGCEILDSNKNVLGIVHQVEEFPAQITLRVKRSKQPDFFVPFVKEFIKDVDIQNKSIIINVLEGML